MTAPAALDAADYAASISTLRDALLIIDGAQYLAGDQINRILDAFPDITMETIADDANMSVSCVYDWSAVSRFYCVELREHYTRLELTFSHLRLAKRLKTMDKACAFLDECVLMKWSVRYAAIELAKRLNQPIDPPPMLSIPVTLTYERGRWIVDGCADLDTSVLYRATIRIGS